MQKCFKDNQQIPDDVVIAMSGLAKLFVGEMVQRSYENMETDNNLDSMNNMTESQPEINKNIQVNHIK